MAKLHPLINHLEKKIGAALVTDTVNFDVDESMIPYFGCHGLKQFIQGKPVRFGFKSWCLNAPNGYLIAFDIYQGASGLRNLHYEEKHGKTGAAVMSLLDKIPDHVPCPIHLLLDNFFTCLPLMLALKENRIMVTGTMRQDCIPKMCPLTSVKEMKKTKTAQGTTSIACNSKNKINFCRWKDNAVVTVASTAFATTPAHHVKQMVIQREEENWCQPAKNDCWIQVNGWYWQDEPKHWIILYLHSIQKVVVGNFFLDA